ncbi:hypothetical protein IM660_11365 [Ruania alkalisoli]|uniref:Uncharacterized protein n=1 Tax=Ruania alkalisoli TaxID=2779775 RepID=A0A7M1SRT8_9MICO|nr:hypothetical protein [Ruania alkalisoli]QOR69303.1 hypothetical protein IM660_11365 [Ruania alkalisoli]
MTASPLEQIHRWVTAGGGYRTQLVREGIAVDLTTCDGGEAVETVTVPRAAHEHLRKIVHPTGG